MKVSELVGILQKLHSIYASAGAKSQASDMEQIIGVLQINRDQALDDFVAEAKVLIAQLSQKPGQKINDALVDEYANSLLESGTDESAFKTAFSGLKSDRDVTKPTLYAIVNRYINSPSQGAYVFKFNSKKEALEKLRIKFIERAESESKDRIVRQ